MNTYEHLMTVLGEEGNEVAVRVSKVLRFGPFDIEPGQDLMAIERLEDELHDFLGILCEVVGRKYVLAPTNEVKILNKRIKVLKMLELARKLGRVWDDDDDDGGDIVDMD